MRVFRAERRVRLADADPSGRCRLDAIARYLHDVSNDDTQDSGLVDDGSWVVRRTALTITRWPHLFERLELATWCSGVGSRWAERSVSITGVRGAAVEARALWVYVDVATMAPRRLADDFVALYDPEGTVPAVASKLLLPGTPPPDATRSPWPLRRTDLDVLDHVNNAAYWAAVEELLADELGGPCEATIEYARAIPAGAAVTLAQAGSTVWFEAGGSVAATALLSPPAAR